MPLSTKTQRPGALPFDAERRVMTDAEAGNLKTGDRVIVEECPTGHCYKAEVMLRTPASIRVRLDRTQAIMDFERDQQIVTPGWGTPHPPHAEDGQFCLRTTDAPTPHVTTEEALKDRLRRAQDAIQKLNNIVQGLPSRAEFDALSEQVATLVRSANIRRI